MTREEFADLLDHNVLRYDLQTSSFVNHKLSYEIIGERIIIDSNMDIILGDALLDDLSQIITSKNRSEETSYISHRAFNKEKLVVVLTRELPSGIVFNNKGDVILREIKKISDNTTFNNEGNVNIFTLRTLPEHTQFRNKGDVILDKIYEAPNGASFFNQGDVVFRLMKKIPFESTFMNSGQVDGPFMNNIKIPGINKKSILLSILRA